MKNRIWIMRTILISVIVGILVYIHGLQDSIVIERFSKLAYYKSEGTWSRNKWLGIPAWQNPNDAWIIQEIINEVRPDYIVEAGTLMGGSALMWAMVLREVNPNGKVITIDIEDQAKYAKRYDLSKKMIQFIIGSSTDPKVVAQIVEEVKGKKALVILDSDHHRDHVLKEMQSYAPLINVGSYLIVQDSNIGGHPVYVADPDPGPMAAIETFLSSNSNFRSDADRERLLYTTNPRGYLKRLN